MYSTQLVSQKRISRYGVAAADALIKDWRASPRLLPIYHHYHFAGGSVGFHVAVGLC